MNFYLAHFTIHRSSLNSEGFRSLTDFPDNLAVIEAASGHEALDILHSRHETSYRDNECWLSDVVIVQTTVYRRN